MIANCTTTARQSPAVASQALRIGGVVHGIITTQRDIRPSVVQSHAK